MAGSKNPLMRMLAMAVGLGALGVLPLAGQAGTAQAAVTRPAVIAPTVTGTWKIHTTDCAFGCYITVAVVQSGHVLSSPTDPNVHGTKSGMVMVLARSVAPGKLWECVGNVRKVDTKWAGGFTAVIGTTTTTGTFTATKS